MTNTILQHLSHMILCTPQLYRLPWKHCKIPRQIVLWSLTDRWILVCSSTAPERPGKLISLLKYTIYRFYWETNNGSFNCIFIVSKNFTFDPERAIVPRLEINSSLVIPTPVSWIVRILFCLSVAIWISKLRSPPPSTGRFSLKRRYRSFSRASLALDINSRTKTWKTQYQHIGLTGCFGRCDQWQTYLFIGIEWFCNNFKQHPSLRLKFVLGPFAWKVKQWTLSNVYLTFFTIQKIMKSEMGTDLSASPYLLLCCGNRPLANFLPQLERKVVWWDVDKKLCRCKNYIIISKIMIVEIVTLIDNFNKSVWPAITSKMRKNVRSPLANTTAWQHLISCYWQTCKRSASSFNRKYLPAEANRPGKVFTKLDRVLKSKRRCHFAKVNTRSRGSGVFQKTHSKNEIFKPEMTYSRSSALLDVTLEVGLPHGRMAMIPSFFKSVINFL